MIRTCFFLLLLLPACAETQFARAFNPRPAAVFVPSVARPNDAAERGRDLASALDRSLDVQEAVDHEDQPLISGATVATHAVRVRREDDSDPVATQR